MHRSQWKGAATVENVAHDPMPMLKRIFETGKVRRRTAPRVLEAISVSNQERFNSRRSWCCCGLETLRPTQQYCDCDQDHELEGFRHEKLSHRRPRPRLSDVPLPLLVRYTDRSIGVCERRHSCHRQRSPRLERCRFSQARYNANSSSESDSGTSGSESDESDRRHSSIRNERFRSLAALSRLQHTAAIAIQEYRFYRRRCMNRRRRATELETRAQAWLNSFLKAELERELVPLCLLELLADKRDKALVDAQRRRELIDRLAIEMRDELIAVEVARATRDVFTSVLRELVAEYMSARAPQKLERAATNPARAVAFDMLAEWTRELTQEVLLQALDELTSEYLGGQQSFERVSERSGATTELSSGE